MTDTNTADTTAALFAAIDSGNEDRVIELINAGADIFATDAEGASTLTHAQRQGNEIIIQTLQMMAEAQGKEFAVQSVENEEQVGFVDVPVSETEKQELIKEWLKDEDFKSSMGAMYIRYSESVRHSCVAWTLGVAYLIWLVINFLCIAVFDYSSSWFMCLTALISFFVVIQSSLSDCISFKKFKQEVEERGLVFVLEQMRSTFGRDMANCMHYLARLGDADEMYRHAVYLQSVGGIGRLGYTELYLKAANKGHKRAMLALANCYEEGDCVKQDPVEAAKWRDRAEKARAAEYRIDEMQGNRR